MTTAAKVSNVVLARERRGQSGSTGDLGFLCSKLTVSGTEWEKKGRVGPDKWFNVKSTCICRGPGFDSQNPHDSQPTITVV